MRRVKKSVVVVTMMLFSMILFSMTNVHAANKKLKVNKVYTLSLIHILTLPTKRIV